MLWDAGQERIGREGRERLAESFVAARDAALDVLVSTGQMKAKGTWKLPSYIEGPRAVHSPAVRDMTLAKLAVMFPGMVRQGPVQ